MTTFLSALDIKRALARTLSPNTVDYLLRKNRKTLGAISTAGGYVYPRSAIAKVRRMAKSLRPYRGKMRPGPDSARKQRRGCPK